MSGRDRAPFPSPKETPAGVQLTITVKLTGAPGVEAATGLVERWLADELRLDQLRPLSVAAVWIDADGLLIPDTALAMAARRKRLYLTQEDLAALAGISRQAVCQIERGRTSLASGDAIAIRQALKAAEAR